MKECDCWEFVGRIDTYQSHVRRAVQDFVEGQCVVGEAEKSPAGDLMFAFQTYWKERHSNKFPGVQMVGRHLRSLGYRKGHARLGGSPDRVWFGLNLKE